MSRFFSLLAPAALLAVLHAPAAAQPTDRPVLELRPCSRPGFTEALRCGTYHAPENREIRGGRTIPLDVVVIPARSTTPRPDPIFFVVGGPGQTAGEIVGIWAQSPLRDEREVVMVDQRGTSPSHALNCRLEGSADNLQGYLDPIFTRETFRRCRAELETRADLTRYTTADYVDDLDEVRRALGYERINLQGGSYGSRVVLFYLRQYPGHVRTGFATGIYPASMRNPLYHAQDTQAALDSVFALCARDAACGRAFPDLRGEFAETMDRLRRQPARVTVAHPVTGAAVPLTMDANAFAEGVRVMMYQWERSRRLPLLLHRAHAGEYGPFAEAALASNASLRDMLRFGLLMSAICSEDMPRITEDDIVRETAGTFLGDVRVRTQKAACDEWPRRDLPPGLAQPVRSDAPVLLVSGAYDPATAARWGELAARTLPNSLHVVIPAAHTAGSPCVDRMRQEFLDRGTVQGLDTSCVREMRPPPFILTDDN
jgi:pimeloyl-ACP methyl ester carboxylesterase